MKITIESDKEIDQITIVFSKLAEGLTEATLKTSVIERPESSSPIKSTPVVRQNVPSVTKDELIELDDNRPPKVDDAFKTISF